MKGGPLDFPPRFVEAGADLGDWPTLAKYFKDLSSRSVGSLAALEAWLADWSELEAWLDEEGSRRYVEMTCHTDDAEREARYLAFVEGVVPEASRATNELERKLLGHARVGDLPGERYGVFLRQVQTRAALFREKNLPLKTQDAKLGQQYQKITGGLTAMHEGRERTMQELDRYLEGTDRAVREEVWHKMAAAWREAREAIEAIYDEMVVVRQAMAANADLPDYTAYAFRELERFDYTPGDCVSFARAIEASAVPASRELAERRRALLGLKTLRPWDVWVDAEGREPLKPFARVEELLAGCGRVFHRLDAGLGRQWDRLAAEGLLDLESRKGKAPGGYMIVFEGRRLPFIFMNAVGTQDDVQTMLHECGHAFHALACREEPLTWLRDPPIEFAEVSSMGMELLAGELLDAFYAEGEKQRAIADHLDEVVRFFPWMATVDQFQHWVYAHPKHTRAERSACWLGLHERFGEGVDYGEHREVLSYSWHRKGHPFTSPFYYVEYGIAQLGALGVWGRFRRDRAAGLGAYLRALALGGSRPLPELFEAAGVRFDFSAATVGPAITKARNELREMRGSD